MGRTEKADGRMTKVDLRMFIDHMKIFEALGSFIFIHGQFC